MLGFVDFCKFFGHSLFIKESVEKMYARGTLTDLEIRETFCKAPVVFRSMETLFFRAGLHVTITRQQTALYLQASIID